MGSSICSASTTIFLNPWVMTPLGQNDPHRGDLWPSACQMFMIHNSTNITVTKQQWNVMVGESLHRKELYEGVTELGRLRNSFLVHTSYFLRYPIRVLVYKPATWTRLLGRNNLTVENGGKYCIRVVRTTISHTGWNTVGIFFRFGLTRPLLLLGS